MINTELLIVGAGPAGLCAAIEAGRAGAEILILDRSHAPGGQLVKQTHRFFGSEEQYAATRGFDITAILMNELETMKNVRITTNATALGAYDDGIWSADINGKYVKINPKAVICATGAGEKTLPFPGNDLPGIYGAGAVQTLMNQYGVKPADKVVMLGAGNIGLIVSYQLIQAGVKVLAVVEGSPRIGGYLVHASKLRRLGVPILTSHSVKEAHGKDSLEAVTIWGLDSNWNGLPETQRTIKTDALCVAVGLSPLTELLWQAGVSMVYVPALGGHVPYRDKDLRTSVENIFIAGDVAGVEEASSAMVEGYLAGLSAAAYLGRKTDDFESKKLGLYKQLDALRGGHSGEKLRAGLAQTMKGWS